MTRLHVAPRTCSTCPYRRDTPPGIWDAAEYRKLPAYDQDPPAIPDGIVEFHCHQEHVSGVPTVCRARDQEARAPEANMSEFFILCTEQLAYGGYALWWRPNRSGYTAHLEQAGRYSRAEVASIERVRGTDVGIPVATAERGAVRVVPGDGGVVELLARLAGPPG